ncbi:MAG: hypothetical protein NWR69_06265 [Flavobacteriales bacterium]|nr:hypothetical protein [Flavobacteriales bacterium]
MEEVKEFEGGPVLQEKKQPSKRFKWIKRIFVGLLALVALLFSGLVIAVTVYEDEIATFALQTVQGNLKTKSSIREADLTLWNNFPSVSIRFKDVYVEENSKAHDTLLFAKELYLSFDIVDLFSGKYNIDEIEAKDGSFNMRVDRKGLVNWDVWKPDTSSTPNEKFRIHLEDIVGENISYLYEDEQEKTFIDVKLKELQASGKFTEKQFLLDIETSAFMNVLYAGETEMFRKRNMGLDSEMQVNLDNNTFVIQTAELLLEEVPLSITGSLDYGDHPSIDVHVAKTELDLKEGILLLPKTLQVQLAPYAPSGNVQFNFDMSGPFENLNIASTFSVKDGELVEINSGVDLHSIQLDANYVLKKGTDSVTIANFQSVLGTGTLSANGSIRNLSDPVLNLSVNAETNLGDVKGFFGWDSLAVCDGQISAQSTIQGKIAFQEADSTFDWSQLHLNGRAQVTDGSFQWATSNGLFKNINGVFLLNGSDARVEQLNFNINDNNCNFSGDFYSIIPFFTTDNAVLTVQANLYSNRLDLEKLLSAAGSSDSELQIALPTTVKLNLTTQIDQFLFKSFNASNIKGTVNYANGRLTISPLSMNLANGSLAADFSLFPTSNGQFGVTCTGALNHIDIQQSFLLFDNFGQSYLTHNNIKGNATVLADFQTTLASDLSVLPNSIKSDLQVNIENGELNDVGSFQYLIAYIKGNKWIAPLMKEDEFAEKLRHIKFSTLQNSIHIENSIITFPLMDIESSAMSITIEGTHSFDNVLDYRIGFDLKEMLLKASSTAGDKSGRQIYLYMRGPIDNLEFGLDKDALRSDRVSAKLIEKEKLNRIFTNAFSWRKERERVGQTERGVERVGQTEREREREREKANDKPPIQERIAPYIKDNVSPEAKAEKEKKTPKWLQEKQEYEEEE